MKIDFRWIGKAALAVTCGSLAATSLVGHIGGLIATIASDTPENFFIKEKGSALDETAMSALRANDHVKVLKKGSWQHSVYKWTHPLFALIEKWENSSDKAFIPRTTQRILLGEREVLVSNGINSETFLTYVFKKSFTKESDLQFTYAFFHEVGHHDEARRKGEDSYKTRQDVREAIADNFAVRNLTTFYGPKIKALTSSFRATKLWSITHDTLPALLHPTAPAETAAQEAGSEASDSSYDGAHNFLKRECPRKSEATGAKSPDLYRAYYECLKPHENNLKKDAVAYPINAQMRLYQFIQGYEYLQQLENK